MTKNENDCNCNNTEEQNIVIQQEEQVACTRTFNETVTEVAELIINPVVTPKNTSTICVGPPRIVDRFPVVRDNCTFIVEQDVCVQFDVAFGASPEVGDTGAICGVPGTGECSTTPPPGGCTRTRGFYANNTGITAALLAEAGGSILLGNGGGLSYTVETLEEAVAVLSGNTPVPPTPEAPPLRGQYAQLYAQLLTAKLNVLNGATCDFAINAINAADAFLTNSPTDGQSGAPALSDALDDFNNGLVEGCPSHCE